MAQVLRHLSVVNDPRVLVAALTRDDAAVFRLTDDRAVVATVDFFAPIVDDAYTFGAIAATNAFSDLYAMGATPLFGLNLVGWPRKPEMLTLLGDVVRGASAIADRAGAFVLGGHSIDDPEPKFGMVAIGEVHPDNVITNSGAKPGDILVLTKPLGTGILSTALKRDAISEQEMQHAIDAMTTLNDGAALAMREVADGVHAATDVTGFGLLGHLHALAQASDVGAQLTVAYVPLFPDVTRLIADGMVPGGTERNLAAANEYTTWAEELDLGHQLLLADAQTSGGLLIAVAPDRVDSLSESLRRHAVPAVAPVGTITDGDPGSITVRP